MENKTLAQQPEPVRIASIERTLRSLSDRDFNALCARLAEEDRKLIEENQRAVARIMKRI